MEVLITVIVVAVVVLGIAAYFIINVFYPEWLGMTGKDAQKNIESHKENPDEKNSERPKDFFSR
jgi:hypothetical protein